jgi:hypothetical protein
MTTKTPLQAAVVVICDCICQLAPEDQSRALEAVRVTLGLSASKDPAPPQGYQGPRPPQPFEEDPAPRQPWEDPPARGPLPTVVVQMVNGRPVIANQQVGRSGPGLGLIRVGPGQLSSSRLRQLPAPRLLGEDAATADALLPGEAPPPAQLRRGGYVRPTR